MGVSAERSRCNSVGASAYRPCHAPAPPSRPVYDDAMKLLADDDLGAILSVVGVDARSDEPLSTELPGSTIRADLLADIGAGVVHVEFVKDTTPDLDLRMLDYRLRLRRRHRQAPITQYILALTATPVPDRYRDPDPRGPTCSWTVVRVGELDPVALLATPTTAPLAALACTTRAQGAACLTSATELIKADTDPDRANRLVGAAITLASIVLPESAIITALREADMPVPVRDTPLGRKLFEEGLQAGRHEEAERMAVAWLRQRFGTDARIPEVAARLAALPDEDRIARISTATSVDDLLDP